MDKGTAMARAWDMRLSLMRVALSMLGNAQDAEDAVSSAILAAGGAAASLRDESRFGAWVMRILVRACYDILRARRRETPGDTPCQAPAFDASGGALWAAIQELPDHSRRVLILYYYEGFKAREIAGILGVPLGTVVGRLARARAQLKQRWTAEESDEKQSV